MRRKNVVLFDVMEVRIGPHVDDDVQDDDFNKTRLLSVKYYDQYTGLELDPVGAAAVSFDPGRKRISAWDGGLLGCGGSTVTREMSSGRSFGVVWSSKRHVRQAPSASRTSPPSHPAPPLEVVRLFCSLMMSRKGRGWRTFRFTAPGREQGLPTHGSSA